MTNSKNSPDQQTNRVVRVFISSTFRDMQAERDELVKRTFPQLRKLCEDRGVTWSEVDLRWGVTDEQTAEGKVLPICLEEINNCRPYFICLLGQRYGWIPDELPQELVEREPWLMEHRSSSVTELEILHGVLNNPAMAQHALFYFRSPSFIESLPPHDRLSYLEVSSPEEVSQFGPAEAERRASERTNKLAALKVRIRQTNLPIREDYPDPQALGGLVLSDLGDIINRQFPEHSEPTALERDELEHEAFARSRAGVYISRSEYFDRLDEHVRGSHAPLVLLGDSGVGKSALLANWGLKFRESSSTFVLMHFVGATPYSCDWATMLRRIMGELKQHFGIEEKIPDQADQLRRAFSQWLQMAASKGRVVLVLDALNQLEDRDGALDLVWLPSNLPANVRLIVSSLPGQPAEELKVRGWPSLTVEPLTVKERHTLIVEYLARYRKALSTSRIERIATATQSANPLFLCSLLEELRLHGDHFTLDLQIDDYLAAPSIPELYRRILGRYEKDYQRERPQLVSDTMSLLWAARRGLSETELLELLGSQQAPLPRASWSPLYLAAHAALVSRSGLMGFVHAYLRQAVSDRYLLNHEAQRSAHRRLAEYFLTQPLGPRKIDELPWQLAEAGEWQKLYNLLSDQSFVEAAWSKDPLAVLSSWTRVEANSSLRMTEAYLPLFESNLDLDFATNIALLLSYSGYVAEALILQKRVLEQIRKSSDPGPLAVVLGVTAGLLDRLGETDEALSLLQEQERICSRVNDREGSLLSLVNQGKILSSRNDLEGALILFREAERVSRSLNNRSGLCLTLSGQANICFKRREHDQALILVREVERLCREVNDKLGVADSLQNQAMLLNARSDTDQALTLLEKAEAVYREVGSKEGVALCLNNKSRFFQRSMQLDRALGLCEEAERLHRAIGDKDGLEAALTNKGDILRKSGRADKALAVYEEAIALSRVLGKKADIARGTAKLAHALHQHGYTDQAFGKLDAAEKLSRELRDKDLVQSCLAVRADLKTDEDELEAALEILSEQEQICRAISNQESLAICLLSKANILNNLRSLDEALPLYRESEKLLREQNDKTKLALNLGGQATVHAKLNRIDEALRLHSEEESLYREVGDEEGIKRSLVQQENGRRVQHSEEKVKDALEDLKAAAKDFMHGNDNR